MSQNTSTYRIGTAASLVGMTLILAYLVIAVSAEFGPYTPVLITTNLARFGAVLGGMVAGLFTRGLSGAVRGLAMVGIVFIPLLLYGTLLVLFWSALGTGLIDVIIVTAARRVLAAFITEGILIALGVVTSVFLGFFLMGD